ncbi:hypothetical protein RN001_015352 [Aquatica leii]|uniref:Glucosidase II subunit alpha n=1 Tax=Aquatica leii TaxID=1421715 RepID=A0AAN7P1P5_9COLE|nr:hypothetical protein RN001_015352 [Aquatica leii]
MWSEKFKSHHDSKPRGPEAIGFDFTFPEAHRAYGLPEHADRMALRTTTSGGSNPYRFYNLDVFEYELDVTMAIYGAVPVLYAHSPSHTVGVFWNNAAEMWVDITNSKDGNVVSSLVSLVSGQKQEMHVDAHFMSESGLLVDLFVFLGPTMQKAVQQYTKLTGSAPIPQNYNDEDDVRTVVEKFDEHNFPLDVMWPDIEYTDGKKYFTWDPIKFKHPETSYLDFFDPKVWEYYSGLYALDKFVGTMKDVYIWNDMNEPSVFNDVATFEGLLKRSGNKLRPFVLTRVHFAGSQRYTAVWTGDNAVEWSHLAYSIPMCLSEALGGISFCGADVGGFFKNPDEELLQRWYQTGAWLPFYRAHAHIDTKRREPYLYNSDVQNRIWNALRQRYAHLPVWYTLFHEHEETGELVIRPLVYHYPSDLNVFDIDNQLLVGSSIMVRPVTESRASSVSVYFPGGPNEIWYDVEDFKPFCGINIPFSMDKVPVYYRGGSIIPRKDRPRRASTLTHDDPFTLYVALDDNKSAKGTFYIDDNESYDYKNNLYIYIKFTYKDGVLSSSLIDDARFSTTRNTEKQKIGNN